MDQSFKPKICRSLGDMPSTILINNAKILSFDDEDTDPEPNSLQFPVNCPKSIFPSAKSLKVTRVSSLTSISSNKFNCSQFEQLADLAKQLNFINKRLAKSEGFNQEILDQNNEIMQRIQNLKKYELEDSDNFKTNKIKCLNCPNTCEVF